MLAGIAFLACALVPVVVVLVEDRTLIQPGVLFPGGALVFLAACAFYRARFGDDSLPDRMERARRVTMYSLGLWITAALCIDAVVRVGKLF